MNLFLFSIHARECVAAYCDTHIVKMPLELAQLLYFCWIVHCGEDLEEIDWRVTAPFTLKNKKGEVHRGYRATKGQISHPIAQWIQWSRENYLFAASFGIPMCEEYTRRFGRVPHSQRHLQWLIDNVPDNFEHVGLTPMPQAMPDEYKIAEHTGNMFDVVDAYRQLMCFGKMHLAKWKYSEPPEWLPAEYVELAQQGLIAKPGPLHKKPKNPRYVAQRVLTAPNDTS